MPRAPLLSFLLLASVPLALSPLVAGCGSDAASPDAASPPDMATPDLTTFAACTGPTPTGALFDTSTPGIGSRDLAGDFTVPTLDGDWSFQKRWTGCDSAMFILYSSTTAVSQQLWQSSVDDLLAGSPPDVHYFFASYASNADVATKDVTAMKANVDAALANLSAADRDKWTGRFHYVTAGARTLNNWISQMLAKRGVPAFGIDRFQRIREVGLLSPVNGQANPWQMAYLANEVRYYDFEWQRDQKLRAEKSPTIIHVLDGSGMDQMVDVKLPDATVMKTFDTMELDLGMWCKDHLDNNCAQWDYIQDLTLCDKVDPTKCDTIIGRFITTYHREGRWVVDVSPLLAFLQDGGTRRFHYNSQYLNQLDIRLSNSGRADHPTSAIPLWNGEWAFDKSYNSHFMPQSVPIPMNATRVQLFAFISGHGFGKDLENCAEFCDHEHRFTVGGGEFVKDFPMAGSEDGCVMQIEQGTVPNQYGTWPFGRGGWCPGKEVTPYIADVTDKAPPGSTAMIGYRGTFNGKDYVPVAHDSGGGGFGAIIRIQSWLVISTK